MFVSPPLDASVSGQAYPPFSLSFESYVPSPVVDLQPTMSP